jgi:uncharacterized membrane protein YbhN (UPF0104 family)
MHYMLEGRIKVNFIFLIKLVITSGIITYLMYSCNIAVLASTLSSINILLAVLTFAILQLVLIVGGVNLWLLMDSISSIPLTTFIRAYSYGYAVNLFSPGQLGDISMAIFLKRDGIYYSHSTLAYAVDKLISLLFILSLCYVGARFLLKDFAGPTWIFGIPLVCIICAMVCITLIVCMSNETGQIGRVKRFIKSLHTEVMLWDAKYKAIVLNITLTIIRWLILSLTYYLAFRTFGIETKWPEVGIIPMISTLIGYIPISIGGIGTVELCAVYLFSLISIDRVYVIDVYLFLRSITYLQAAVILILSNWQFRKARIL